MNQIIMHVNYAESNYGTCGRSVDDICKMAAEIGYDGIEFRGNPPQGMENLSQEEYVQQIAEGKKKYGLSTVLFGVDIHGCANPDKEVREKSINKAIETAKLFNILCGSTLGNCFGTTFSCPIKSPYSGEKEFAGSYAATPEQWELTADSFRKFGEAVGALGMKFGIETHHWYLHDLPEPTMRLIKMIDCPSIGVNMDYGNTFMFPNRPTLEEAVKTYGDKIFYVHFKNLRYVGRNWIATLLSDGEINHREYLSLLKAAGYDGPIALECINSGDREFFAKQDFEYYKAVSASF